MRLYLKKIAIFLALFVPGVLLMQFVWHNAAVPPGIPPEKVNLALRRTGHRLLQAAGDSTSGIAPVTQTGQNVWLLRLSRPFPYDSLPAILQSAFEVHGIKANYDVAVLRCADGQVLLGYNALDFLRDNNASCGGRELPDECLDIQLTFSSGNLYGQRMPLSGWIISVLLAAVLYLVLQRKRSKTPVSEQETTLAPADTGALSFGQSRLDVANQQLICAGKRIPLTYRETKLLHLFVQHPNQVLDRNFILNNVWADEGILVGRSVDMFVSRLRKHLREDASLQLAAVHGVGYRMEILEA